MAWKDLMSIRTLQQPSPLLTALVLFFVTIQYCWVAEHTQLFQATAKYPSPGLFLLCIGLSVGLTLGSWTVIVKPISHKPIDDGQDFSLLPREQTEEWKGWMQAVILLYHLFGLSKNLPIYQVMRVLVAMYIFLTGYSHTSYFLKTNDFSLGRTTKILLRLNLLSCTLAYALNRSCDFYYFPVLTSFWYFVFFVTIRCGRTPSGTLSRHRVSVCLFISCVVVQWSLYSKVGNTVWDNVLSLLYKFGGPHITPREFIFRLKLDSISPYWGALFAMVGTRMNSGTKAWSEHTSQMRPRFQRLIGALTPVIANCITVEYFLAIQQFSDKFSSNVWHPLISIIPLTTMLITRNVPFERRQGYNRCFRWLGSISLETYVLQSHIWLTNNNKSLLHVSLLDHFATGFSKSMYLLINVLERSIITALFLLTSHFAAQATKSLIEWLVSSSKNRIVTILLICWMLNLHWNKIV